MTADYGFKKRTLSKEINKFREELKGLLLQVKLN